ncbi:MAG: hypothetical protein K2J77_12910 [Oscillospiraceae bacterium]|nr:hypothetical protein [Oscillospiraceae bacterium]
MNRNFKAICASFLAAVMCVSLAGCGKSNSPVTTNPNKPNTTASKPNATTTSKPATTVSKPAPAQSTTVSTPEKAELAITDEIKNADFNSGLIQINNDIFQMGGYLTVAEFVKKYKDRYDIVYANGKLPYEEAAKEQLLQSYDYVGETKYHLFLTAKNGDGDSSKRIAVQIENRTTSGGEDKIPLPEAIVTGFGLNDKNMTTYPFWYPGGFTDSQKAKEYGFLNQETANTDYTKEAVFQMLEDKGFTLFEGNPYTGVDLTGKYWKSAAAYEFYETGEVNAFGKKPVFHYQIALAADTDKLSSIRIIGVKYVD